MKKSLLAAAMALTSAIGFAQTNSVILTNVLAVEQLTTAPVNTATYVPVADEFLVGHAAFIERFNGITGAPNGALDTTVITPAGNGFFALTATDAGFIYGHEDGGKDIWRWENIDGAPTKVFDTVNGLQRFGATATTDAGIKIAFTGSANDGPVEFFSDSFPFASGSFTFNESVQLNSKSGLALSSDGNTIFTVGTTGERTINKFNLVDGTWVRDALWPAPQPNPATAEPIGAGAFAFDTLNNILFVHDMRGVNNNSLKAYNGTTGEVIGTAVLPVNSGTLAGYAGAYVAPILNAGTLWVAARGRTTSSHASLYKWTYVINTSNIGDWSLYKE